MSQYYNDLNFDAIFKEAFDAIINKCSRILSSKEALKNNPEVAADFFGISRRFLNKKKAVFYNCSFLEDILTVYMSGIGLEHPESAEYHSKFLIELLEDLSSLAKRSNMNINDLKLMQVENHNPEVIQ
jgi:uncharacterized protein (DUF2344 family)